MGSNAVGNFVGNFERNRAKISAFCAIACAMLAAAGCSTNSGSGGNQGAGAALPGGGNVSGFGKSDTTAGNTGADKDAATASGDKDVAAAGADQSSSGGGKDAAAAGADAASSGGKDTNPPADDAAVVPDPDADPGTDPDADPGPDPDADPGTQDTAPQNCIVDLDGDDYGEGCPKGEDCDDSNPNFNVTCPDCSKPGTTGCACTPGSKSLSCYSGDPAWLGKGLCLAGKHDCTDGFWSECKNEVFPEPEKCDNKDNDCDGLTDEGVKSTCGTCDLTCNEQKVGNGSTNDWNLNSENSTGVGISNGSLVLDQTQISLNLKFIWIANSPNSTVSKVDCKTMKEVGRFAVCSDPSRTSVDLEGNVWVGCRGDGKVAKIMAETKNCIDKNGNGVIETSSGAGAGANVLPAGQDECVKFIVQPDGPTIARAAGVDKDNHVWMGFWNSSNLHRLEPNAGNSVDKINIACNPYGLVIDQKGIIWAQGAGCGNLVRVDPATKQINKYPYAAGAYGINVDKFGRVWVASGGSASCFDPTTLKWTVVPGIASGGRGVATANDGYVYTAADGSSAVTKINGNNNPPNVEMVLKGASFPVGVALDYDGFVWAVNQGGSSTTKFDAKANQAIGTVPVGSSPYTYSDMTGYTLNYFTAPKGQYTTVFFGGVSLNPITQNVPKQVWQSVSADAELPEGTALRMRFRAADTKDLLEKAAWSDPVEFPPEKFPYQLATKNIIGNLLQVEVQLTTKDKKVTPMLKSLSAKSKLM